MQYVIATMPRSGSFLLCDLLSKCGAGKPDEHFHPFRGEFAHSMMISKSTEQFGAETVEKYRHQDVFATKVMSNWLEYMRLNLETPLPDNGSMLQVLFPDSKYIFLTRRDRVRQAISFCRASDTGQWAQGQAKAQNQQAQQWNVGQLNDQLCLRIRSTVFDFMRTNQTWIDAFAAMKVEPLQVCYEDLVDETGKTLKIICDYLEVDVADFNVESSFQRQSDALNDQLAHQFINWRGFKARPVSVD